MGRELTFGTGRLKSIRNIEKITKTMKIVASTKMTRAQRAMTDSRTYGQTSNQVFKEAETKPAEDKKTLLVIASSDKGLCGGIHSGLSRTTRRMLIDDPEMDIAIIGEKCKSQIGRSNGRNVVLSFAGVGRDIPTFADAQAIADQLTMLPTDYASIKILYNRFINATMIANAGTMMLNQRVEVCFSFVISTLNTARAVLITRAPKL